MKYEIVHENNHVQKLKRALFQKKTSDTDTFL